MTISERSNVRFLPQIRYRDVEGSARWLCHAFGFQVHSAVRNPEGVMDYVHLVHGPVNVIVKAHDDSAPADTNAEAQTHYIHVDDVEEHYAIAIEEGAEVVIDLQSMPGAGRGYTCRDAEGLIWSFGSYDPWRIASMPKTSQDFETYSFESEPQSDASPTIAPQTQSGHLPHGGAARSSSRGIVLALIGGGLVGTAIVGTGLYYEGSSRSFERLIASERAHREKSEAATRLAQNALEGERKAKEQFQRASQLIKTELAAARTEKAKTETQLHASEAELATQASALEEARDTAAALQGKLTESEKQWRVVQQSLSEELDNAKATVARAQAERATLEATMKQRVFSLETSLSDEQSSRKVAEAARSAAYTQLAEARRERRQAEAALLTAMTNLKTEREARVAAEQVAEQLRSQLAAKRGPVRKVARAKPPVKPRPVAAKPTAPAAKKVTNLQYDTWGDFVFQP